MLYKKKLDTCFDTHGIKIGVQLWRRVRDSNPRFLSESLVFKTSSLNHSDNSPCVLNYTISEEKSQEHFPSKHVPYITHLGWI